VLGCLPRGDRTVLLYAARALARAASALAATAAPDRPPIARTLAYGHHEDRTPTHGYEATREAAMAAALAKGWRRELMGVSLTPPAERSSAAIAADTC